MSDHPVYPSKLHSDVIGECQSAWAKGRPWTQIRELRKGVDDPEGHRCIGVIGRFDQGCDKPVAGVQYTTAFGDPVFYCEDHAVAQFEWDRTNYDEKPKPIRELPEGYFAEVEKMFERMNRKKRKKEEPPEEADPTA